MDMIVIMIWFGSALLFGGLLLEYLESGDPIPNPHIKNIWRVGILIMIVGVGIYAFSPINSC